MKNAKPLIRNLAIAGVTAGLAAFYVLTGHAARDYPSIDRVEREIAAVNAAVDVASNKDDLPRLSDTWESIKVIAAAHDVKVTSLDAAKDAGITSSDIPGGTPWYGVMQGKTKNVAVAAIEVQQAVPVLYGAAALDNKVIGLSFAALGSTDDKGN